MCKLASLPWRALRITALRRSGIMRGLLVVMLLPWEATGRMRRLIGWSGKQIEMSSKGGARCWQEVNRNSPSHWLFSSGAQMVKSRPLGREQRPLSISSAKRGTKRIYQRLQEAAFALISGSFKEFAYITNLLVCA